MPLYDPEGRPLNGSPDQPIEVTPVMPLPNAMAGHLGVALNDGMTVVWPLHPDDIAIQIVDVGDGPEPVVMVRVRRKYTHTETGEKHLAALPHELVPAFIADFYREGGVDMPDDLPELPEDAIRLVNLGVEPVNGSEPNVN